MALRADSRCGTIDSILFRVSTESLNTQASKIMSAPPTHRGKRNHTVTITKYLQQQKNDATTVGNSSKQSNSEAQQSRETKATARQTQTKNDVCNRIQQPSPNQKPRASTQAQATANEKISPNFKMSMRKLPRHKICRRKCILTLLSQQQQSAEPPVSVCTKISVTKERRIFYSLLTKILFSYRSTEV